MAKSPEQRKAASIEVLKSRGVPWIEHLPRLHGVEEVAERSAEEVFMRMRGCFVYFMRSQAALDGVPLERYRRGMDRLGAWDALSAQERAVVEAEELTERQVIGASWALEAVFALQWALGLAGDGDGGLPWPGRPCDMGEVMTVLKQTESAAGLRLRGVEEMLDQLDLHYRITWAVRDGMLKGREAPGVEGSVAFERRRALEWLAGEGGVGWDEVELST